MPAATHHLNGRTHHLNGRTLRWQNPLVTCFLEFLSRHGQCRGAAPRWCPHCATLSPPGAHNTAAVLGIAPHHCVTMWCILCRANKTLTNRRAAKGRAARAPPLQGRRRACVCFNSRGAKLPCPKRGMAGIAFYYFRKYQCCFNNGTFNKM